ncbi:hypothetical protein DXG03_000702 [Asterophora parasitica]|uniref:Uncharacterized protein n=1 Tax=Asterophora parasitica TaxID=117018 RepID=A0A9P7GA55_9AGAR|nr:hypothetical protein DXG03_000702 [Asterophora parasitica]
MEAVRALLRSSEDLRVVLEAATVHPSVHGSEQTTAVHGTRIVAVVAHRDGWHTVEEGRPAENDFAEELEIQRVFPITSDFSITMAQTTGSGPIAQSSAEQQSGFRLTIQPGKGLDLDIEHVPMTLFTRDIQGLRNLLKECKELNTERDISKDPPDNSTLEYRFSWLTAYTSRRALPRTFGLIPQDVRLARQPLYNQLSPAVAGTPGDDVSDVRLIRDAWIRAQAREASRKGRRRLKIRLGTFNVNGKLPSQDLSGWIGSSLEDVAGNPLDAQTDQTPPVNTTSSKPHAFLNSSFQSSTPTLVNEHAADELEYVDSDPNPDMLVLGFQELDLSTEALIYSTGTSREDAWCLAVFAALGAKGPLYEKVQSLVDALRYVD